MKHMSFMIVVVLAAAFSRLLPHPPNFTPVAALALAGGVYFDRRFALIIPAIALLLSDFVIGIHSLMPFVYGSFVAIAAIGLWVRSRKSIATVAAATLAGSILFFVITNFGVWLLANSSIYPRTLAGLGACYIAALPFFRNTLLGDVVYTGVLFGIFEMATRSVQRTPQESDAHFH